MSNNDGKSSKADNYPYKVRPANFEDLDQIYQIENMSFRDAYPLGLLSQLIKDRDAICLIIEIDQKIVGFIFGIMRRRKRGRIISIAVHPKYRNCNFGSILVDQLISALKKNGIVNLELEVRISNKIAQKLYKKFNFIIKVTKHRYYPDGEDAYLMVYKLEN